MICSIDKIGTFNIRPFRIRDDFNVAAEYIYDTDRYIYPYWQPDLRKFQEEVAPLMRARGFLYHYGNCYGAFYRASCNLEVPYGIFCILDTNTDLKFDYSTLKRIDDRHEFVLTNYVEKLIAQRQTMPLDALLGVCLCTTPKYRGYGIGKKLMEVVLAEKASYGYRQLHFDCLQDNSSALRLYQDMGCKITSEGICFDGTNQSQVKTYNMVLEI